MSGDSSAPLGMTPLVDSTPTSTAALSAHGERQRGQRVAAVDPQHPRDHPHRRRQRQPPPALQRRDRRPRKARPLCQLPLRQRVALTDRPHAPRPHRRRVSTPPFPVRNLTPSRLSGRIAPLPPPRAHPRPPSCPYRLRSRPRIRPPPASSPPHSAPLAAPSRPRFRLGPAPSRLDPASRPSAARPSPSPAR